MSLESLCRAHQVDIYVQTVTQPNGDMAAKEDWTLQQADVYCRIVPLDPSETMKFGQRNEKVSHKLYFTTDPNVDNRCRFLCGASEIFTYRGQKNPDRLDRYWIVYCEANTANAY